MNAYKLLQGINDEIRTEFIPGSFNKISILDKSVKFTKEYFNTLNITPPLIYSYVSDDNNTMKGVSPEDNRALFFEHLFRVHILFITNNSKQIMTLPEKVSDFLLAHTVVNSYTGNNDRGFYFQYDDENTFYGYIDDGIYQVPYDITVSRFIDLKMMECVKEIYFDLIIQKKY